MGQEVGSWLLGVGKDSRSAAEYVTPHSGDENDLLIVVAVGNVLKMVEFLKLNFSR